MQTFLPYPAFEDVATILDYRRLGKQRVEGYQILNILAKPPDYKGAWINHPAVKIWRGFRNNMCLYEISRDELRFPWWLGDPRLHDSHKSNLLRKDYHYYSQFHWNVPPDLPYFWPVT